MFYIVNRVLPIFLIDVTDFIIQIQ